MERAGGLCPTPLCRLPRPKSSMKRYRFVLAGLAGAAFLLWSGLEVSNWKTARLEGRITQVRTLGMDERSSVAIVDFEARNPSDVEMMIGDRTLSMINAQGIPRTGRTISAADLKGLFDYFPALGLIEHDPLLRRVRVSSGDRISGMIAARFEVPKHELDLRRELTLRIGDLDGSVSEITLLAEPAGESQ